MNIGTRLNSDTDQQDNGQYEKYCYDDDDNNCFIYGGMYVWDELMQYADTEGTQGICPTGWHVPSDIEWEILEGEADSFYDVGDPEWDSYNFRGSDVGLNLKSVDGWFSGGNGTDLFGFNALPGGWCGADGIYYNLTFSGVFWSSTDVDGATANIRELKHAEDKSGRGKLGMGKALSVRCLKDLVCNDSITDPRDGKNYGTIKIGDQCWMSQNMNVGIRVDYSTSEGAQGICPPGWHIPTDQEMKILEGYVDSQYNIGDPAWDINGWRGYDAGLNLKSKSLWSNNGTGTDKYGFNAYPAGILASGSYQHQWGNTYYWTSTEFSLPYAWYRVLYHGLDKMARTDTNKSMGVSVRCLKTTP